MRHLSVPPLLLRTQGDAPPQQAGLDDLPDALLLKVMLLLPLAERTRCALVSRRFAALLCEACFWSELEFTGARAGSLSDETVLDLCRRASGQLRVLDLSSPACDGVSLLARDPGSGLPLLGDLEDEGLGLFLHRLVTWRPGVPFRHFPRLCFQTEDQAAALVAACPRLASAAVTVVGSPESAAAVLRVLPAAGDKQLVVADGGEGLDWLAVAGGLCAALASSSVAEVAFENTRLDRLPLPQGLRSAAAAEAAETAAVDRLASALASAAHGPRVLRACASGLAASPLFGPLCLAAASRDCPLRELHLEACDFTSTAAAELAGALAGGSGVEKLNLRDNSRMVEGPGCVPRHAGCTLPPLSARQQARPSSAPDK